MSDRHLSVIVLAAGAGTRMRSSTPKVLHAFAGRSMLGHVLAAVEPLGPARVVVVVGHGRDTVTEHLGMIAPDATAVVQEQQQGTGHAVRVALDALDAQDGDVLVLPADAPLLTADTVRRLVDGPPAALTAVVADPTGYGRVVRAFDTTLERVVEHKDADEAERSIDEVATGVYLFDEPTLRDAVAQLTTDNVQGEYYLPDVVSVLRASGRPLTALVAPAVETAGVNDRAQLAAAHRVLNDRLLHALMLGGVRVVDPATTWVDVTVAVAADATLLPGTELRGATRVAAGAVVGPHSTLTDTDVGPGATLDRTVALGAVVGPDVTVGPFAYLRPGTELAAGAHVGTYVEVKNSRVGEGSKVPHLSYVGDATIGEHSNIGAATVFVNYDGVAKHRSTVGDHVRIGSDTMIVAPRTIGDGAYTAAGSVITADVPPGAMAVGRAPQRNVAGWVQRRRAGTPAADAAARALRDDDASDPT